MKKTLLIVGYLITALLSQSQNYKEDVLEVGKNFKGVRSYSLSMIYQLFIDDNYAKPYEERVMEIKKSGNALRVKQNNGMEIIDNERCQLMIDDDKKTLTYLKKSEVFDSDSTGGLIYNLLKENLDSLSKIYEKVKLVSKIGNIVTYELIYKPNDQIEKVNISVNKKKKFYDQVTVYYKSKIKIKALGDRMHTVALKTVYANYTQGCAISNDTFSELKFVSRSPKGKVILNKKFSGYKFINPE